MKSISAEIKPYLLIKYEDAIVNFDGDVKLYWATLKAVPEIEFPRVVSSGWK